MPESGSDDVGGSLVWAPDRVRVHLAEQTLPRASVPRLAVRMAVTCFVVTGPVAWLVFAVITLAVPAVTGGAGVATAGFWALLFAALLTVVTLVVSLRRLVAEARDVAERPARRSVVRRLGIPVVLTGVCAGAVLAASGLSFGQTAVLTGALIVVLHLMPMLVAGLLARRLRRSGSV